MAFSIIAARRALAENDMEDTCFSTPALGDSRLYVRTLSALYCFGK